MEFNPNLYSQAQDNENKSGSPDFIRVRQLARAYVPIQRMDKIYDEETALKQGTVFPELDIPYCH